MRETSLVDLIRKLSSKHPLDKTLIKGIGDDCAILRPRPNEDLVFTSDFVLEGRHFERSTHQPSDIGHKALARSLSDLAAMGSEPVFCLVSLALPADLTSRWIRGFYKGFLDLASKHRISLAGGDLSQFDKILADVMCCGRVPRGKALARNTAQLGDFIYVTGELGASALGLRSRRGSDWRRHRRPEPRIEAGRALRRLGVRAAMDLSDGLSLDLARLCRESKVSAELSGQLPIAPGASQEDALSGGEDYELVFTASPRMKMPAEIGGLPVTRIGEVTASRPGQVHLQGRPLKPRGFDHFG